MLSPREATFVERQRVAHLATADAEGRPHAVPVCFVYLGGRFYIPIDEKPKRTQRLRRLRNIEENPRAALVFDHYEEDWERLAYILVRGTASILGESQEHERAVAALRQKYPQYRSMELERRPLVRIEPEQAVGWGHLDEASNEGCQPQCWPNWGTGN